MEGKTATALATQQEPKDRIVHNKLCHLVFELNLNCQSVVAYCWAYGRTKKTDVPCLPPAQQNQSDMIRHVSLATFCREIGKNIFVLLYARERRCYFQTYLNV